MPERIENIIDKVISEPTIVKIKVPPNSSVMQLTIEREGLPEYGNICKAVVASKKGNCSLTWAGGVADFSEVRPGRLCLWTTGKWACPKDDEITVTFYPITEHHVHAHMDFF